MTPCEVELPTKYLTHLNVLGEDGDFADFEEWYQPVRYAKGPRGAAGKGSELRCKDVLKTARAVKPASHPWSQRRRRAH